MNRRNDLRSSDGKISEIIESVAAEEYDNAIAGEDDPALFWHLSALRNGLLGWISFASGSRVLEIGAGFGALTGSILQSGAAVDAAEIDAGRAEALRMRFRGEERLSVLCADVLELPAEPRYDYIVLVRIPGTLLGREAELFRKCADMLRPGGILLAGFDNRYGLNSWCGGLSDRAETPFSVLDGDPAGLYTRSRFDAFLQDAGLSARQHFYPFPDAFFPQAVYSEDSVPSEGIGERVFAYDLWNSPLVADKGRMYDGLSREGLLPGMADYCLGVFSREGEDGPEDRGAEIAGIDQVILSADRGPERSFYVRLYTDGHAEKGALYDKGKAALRQMYGNLEELAGRGIPVIRQQMRDGRIVMPRSEAPTLMTELRRIRTREELFDVFDRMRDWILLSSPAEKTSADGPADTILEKGYIDMIPFNIFTRNGSFEYFDQEFCVPSCPAGYILYRALFYTYVHVPALEKIVSLEEMKDRYGLLPHWEDYRARENAFITKVRSRVTYRQVYGWSEISRKDLSRRRRALTGPDQAENDLLRSVHAVQMELAQELERLCAALGLRYYAIHGTLLGAVRHRGFIPWDEDMDFVMEREDYEILIRKAPGLLKEPFSLQTGDSDLRCYFGGYARLRNGNTTAMTYPEMLHPCNQGIWIDILPLDACDDSESKRKRRQRRITSLQRILYAKYYPAGSGSLAGLSPLRTGWYGILAKCVPGRLARRRLERLYRTGRSREKKSILTCIYGDMPNGNVFDTADFAGEKYLPFEDREIPVPPGYEHILSERYGADYMLLPGPERRPARHHVYLDPGRPYTQQNRKKILSVLEKEVQMERAEMELRD